MAYFVLSDWNYFTFHQCLTLLWLHFVLGSQASFPQWRWGTPHFKKTTESLGGTGNLLAKYFFHPMPVGQTQVLSNACLRGQWEGSAVSCSIFPLALHSPSTASGWAPGETPEARKEWGFGVQNAWNARLEGGNFFTGQFVPRASEIERPFAKSTVGSSSDPQHCQSKNILKGISYGWWLPADADLRVQPALFFPDSISKCCWTT